MEAKCRDEDCCGPDHTQCYVGCPVPLPDDADTDGDAAAPTDGAADTEEPVDTTLAPDGTPAPPFPCAKEKSDFEAELADYKDSIAALNQAIDILASFYRDQEREAQQRAADGGRPLAHRAGRLRTGRDPGAHE